MTNEQLAARIAEENAKLTSMSVKYDEKNDQIVLTCVRYRAEKGQATIAQVRYLQGFDNVKTISTSNLLKANKWFISTCIDIAKNNPDTIFNIWT